MSKKKNGQDENVSKDGKWKSFPKVPYLLQYVPSGMFFYRIRSGAKTIRKSLETDVYTTAKQLLGEITSNAKAETPPLKSETPWAIAEETYRKKLAARVTAEEIKQSSLDFRGYCLASLHPSFPELQKMTLEALTKEQVEKWVAKKLWDGQYWNNVVGTWQGVYEAMGVPFPTKIALRRIKKNELNLPSKQQFSDICQWLEVNKGRHKSDLVRFLAYSGCRLGEARRVTWDDLDHKNHELVIRGDPVTGTKNWDIRRIPTIPAMITLLAGLPGEHIGPLLLAHECRDELEAAWQAVDGCPRITHHDLRHLFATTCIEAGVDIPTLSRWLGHHDGGTLALKTYGHLRNEHSQAQAAKVNFG